MAAHYPNADNSGPLCGNDFSPIDTFTYDIEYLDCEQCIYATCSTH